MTKSSTYALPMTADYFRLVVRHFGRSPQLAAEIVEGTGFDVDSPEPSGGDEFILLEQQLQQIRNVARIIGSHWALEIGPTFGTAAHGELATAVASAPDLGAALLVLERFAYLRAPYFKIVSTISPSALTLRVRPQFRLETETWISLVETLMLSLQATVESALGRPIQEAEFQMDFDAPTYVDHYAGVFHAPVVFGRKHTCIHLPFSWRSLPCPYSNAKTHRRAIERLEAAERSIRSPEFIAGQIESRLDAADGSLPNIDTIARQLKLSRRTLVRRLTEQGTSFRIIVEQHLRKRAVELLADASLDISQISDRLGYSEPSNFSRAFRRWFDTSPQEYRESATGGEPLSQPK